MITDDHRSGRPPKLDEAEREEFESAVNQPPKESGYDQPAWSTKLAQKFLREEFDVEYSMRHMTRLLNEAGLSHQTPRPKPATSDDEEREIFWESVKKLTSTLPDEYTTIVIDQTRKSLGCDLYRAWFPEGERITMPYWSESEAITFLGAVSDAQETFFIEVSDRFTSDVTVHLLQALQDEFGEKLHIVLDNAPYFASNQVKAFIEESQLRAMYFPTGSPDLNPVEECWRQLKWSLGNRFFQDLDELRADAFEALRPLSVPKITDSF